ncbi:MAG: sulfatase [Algibacter sp.]|uniref:sulfatase family protein n=1 Tax=Algibacter sp. TaxID=1872428 RepID=UPI003299CA46
MILYKKNIFFLLLVIFCISSKAQEDKPNILWLVVEDMSPYLSTYGNHYTTTPTLNDFAKKSVVFTNAFSNGAQCSPARSTLISSIYAPMLATDLHREKRAVPKEFYYPKYLKDAGYYCSNNSKTDYNANNGPKNIWTASNKKASYINREDKSEPFFSVFNYNGTHTKRIATKNTKQRDSRTIALDSVKLPPYLPDVAEIRDDIAWHYDAVNEMDGWIKSKLDELEASGEAENTIVFFYSDHGGCLPRGKAYLYDTGTRVPLMVRFPEKYRHLAGVKTPSTNNNLVGFVDFAPTIFNLLDVDIPDFMMGQPFLGKNLPEPKSEIFLYRANQEQNYIPSRALTTGRYKLIWNFNCAYPNGTRQSYQWQMPSYQGWDNANMKGEVNELQSIFWKPTEALEFFDTKTDPYEVKNLIDSEEHQDLIATMKTKLLDMMKKEKDLGLYPWSMRNRKNIIPFYNYVRETQQPVSSVIDAAAFSSTAKEKDIPKLKTYLKSKQSAIRYWGTIGILQLLERKLIHEIPEEINNNFNNEDENIEVRLLSAEVLIKHHQNPVALKYILSKVKDNHFIAYAVLQNLGNHAKPIEKDLIKLLENKKLNQFYLKSALINTGYMPYEELWKF